jgi:ribose transport system permease protein
VADTAEHPDVAVPQERGYGWRSRLLGDYGIMMVVLVMGVVLTILQPEYFLSAQNLTNIIRQIGMNALLALGLYLVILTAGIDLSVGSVMALSIMLLALADVSGVPWPLVMLIGPAVGTCFGIVNGLGLTLFRLPHPFIMTLGTLNVARGLCNLVTNGRPVSGVSDQVRFLGIADIPLPFGGKFAVIPVSAIVLFVCYAGVSLFLRKV